MTTDAKFSKDRKYRYKLSRVWDDKKSKVMIIGLNPSTADEVENDPTIRRCIDFAKSWGYGGLEMTNLFAFRATEPEDMKNADEPIGIENNEWLLKLSKECDIIVGAWGNDGSFKKRGEEVMKMFEELHYIAKNQTGCPSHPLYLKGSLTPQKFNL